MRLCFFFKTCEPLVQVFDRSFDLLEARFEASRDRCDPVIDVAFQRAGAARDVRNCSVVLER